MSCPFVFAYIYYSRTYIEDHKKKYTPKHIKICSIYGENRSAVFGRVPKGAAFGRTPLGVVFFIYEDPPALPPVLPWLPRCAFPPFTLTGIAIYSDPPTGGPAIYSDPSPSDPQVKLLLIHVWGRRRYNYENR